MHVRWRGIELPAKVILDEKSKSPTFGRFTVEPFERGFGTTVGTRSAGFCFHRSKRAAVTAAASAALNMNSPRCRASLKTSLTSF